MQSRVQNKLLNKRKINRAYEIGKQNPIMLEEEQLIISTVRKALHSSGNAAIIGRNGEKPIIEFLKKCFPKCFMVESGHFITPNGYRSPQIDIMILDSKFPVLCRNSDDSVLAMGHSVLACVSVKCTIRKRELQEIKKWSTNIGKLKQTMFPSEEYNEQIYAIGIESSNRSVTLWKNYWNLLEVGEVMAIIYILRKIQKEQSTTDSQGSIFAYDSSFPMCGNIDECIPTISPLLDFMMAILRESYRTIHSRNVDFKQISELIDIYFQMNIK